jgi:predicted MFS family arabinose efflux permease
MMGSMSARNVSLQTLTSKVPQPAERARLQSAQSAVQHLAAAAGAVGSSALLDASVTDRLVGLDKIVIVCLLLSLPTFPLVRWLESSVKGHAQ